MLIRGSAEKLENAPGGLIKVNLEKTVILANNNRTKIKIENYPLKYMGEVAYLGQQMAFQDMMEKYLQTKILVFYM